MNTEIRTAATAVIIRDGDAGLETLLLRRHQQLKVSGGHWVFPGGGIDPDDYLGGTDDELAARVAAVRETHEEASVVLDPESLQFLSHWTTPPTMGRRFATWFYLAVAGPEHSEVVVDGEEMDDFSWATPELFLDQHRSGEIALLPPTVVTLTELARCARAAEAQRFYREREVPFIAPRISKYNEVVCMLYDGDAGFDAIDPNIEGPKNRCYLEAGVWRYEFASE